MVQLTTRICGLPLLVLASLALPASATNIVFREQATLSGPIVCLGDIADISAASTAEVRDLSTTPLMPVPAPGSPEFLTPIKALDLLESRGIDTSRFAISGARIVKVGQSLQSMEPVTTETVPQLSPGDLEAAVIDAITTHLTKVTGHGDWEVGLTLRPAELRNLAALGRTLVARAGKTPWTGMQKFEIVGSARREPVLITVNVSRLRDVVVATRRIERGSLVGAADVEIRQQGGNVPTTAIQALAQVIGKEAVQAIDANSTLQQSQLRSPLQVQRGETVKVFARTGGITVSTFAIVQQNGALGDLVQVQTLDKKDRFAARVSGWKQLEVLPTGASTADYSAVNPSGTRNR